MRHALIFNTDPQKFLDEVEIFSKQNTIVNIAYSTNTIQSIRTVYSNEPQIGDMNIEVVKTNYSALIQYT